VAVDFKPTLNTTAVPAAAKYGETIHAEATLVGGDSPTGTVTFSLHSPGDTGCYSPVFTSTTPIALDGTATSEPFRMMPDDGAYSGRGTWRWKTSYSGDANNLPSIAQACGGTGMTVTVTRATPTITVRATPERAGFRAPISATAIVSGLIQPSGGVTFLLYKDPACATTRIDGFDRSYWQGTLDEAGDLVFAAGNSQQGDGTYYWRAFFQDDNHNEAAETPCNAPGQNVVVGTVTPTLAITQVNPAQADLGDAVNATATLGGGALAGSVAITLYGPGAPGESCNTGRIAYASPAVDVAGDGAFTSGSFTPRLPGTYWWGVRYTPSDFFTRPAQAICGPNSAVTVDGVLGPNTAPTGTADHYDVDYQGALHVDAPGVLGNDTDAEGDPLTATVVRDPYAGYLVRSGDGSFSYYPVLGHSGEDSFTYVVDDGRDTSGEVTVTITVAPPPVVSGSVVDQRDAPLGGVTVRAYATTDTWLPTATTTTQPDGTYRFTTLPAGTYALQFAAPGLPVQWMEGRTREGASSVIVASSGTAHVLTNRLTGPASISGTVLGPDAQPMADVTVRAYPVGMSIYFPSATTTTAADGTYTLGALLPGTYQVVFQPSPWSGSVAQWYLGRDGRGAADPIVLAGGSTAAGIDIQLAGTGTIVGNAGGPGVTVAAYTPSNVWVGSFQTTSGANGSFTLAGLPVGTYKIAFFPPTGPVRWYGGPTRPTATTLVVTARGLITGIDRVG
jgi:hypothetical protein